MVSIPGLLKPLQIRALRERRLELGGQLERGDKNSLVHVHLSVSYAVVKAVPARISAAGSSHIGRVFPHHRNDGAGEIMF